MNVCASGSAGAISGANTASTTQAATITRPIDGERLAQARVDAARPLVTRAGAEDAGGHVTRIRGSMIP